MAGTSDILQKLGMTSADNSQSETVVEAGFLDKPTPAPNPELTLSNQLQMTNKLQHDMTKELEDILASTHQPSLDLPE